MIGHSDVDMKFPLPEKSVEWVGVDELGAVDVIECSVKLLEYHTEISVEFELVGRESDRIVPISEPQKWSQT